MQLRPPRHEPGQSTAGKETDLGRGGFLRRAIAYLADRVVAIVLLVPAIVVLAAGPTEFVPCAGPAASGALCEEPADSVALAAAFLALGGVIGWGVLNAGSIAALGGTPGHLLLGLRVVRADGRPDITWGRAIARIVSKLFSHLLVGAGFWFAFTNRERETIHDRITGTRVRRMPRAAKDLPTGASIAFLSVLAVALLVAGGAAAATHGSSTTDASSSGPGESATSVVAIAGLEPGRCLQDGLDALLLADAVAVVECGQPHMAEIVDNVTLTDGDWPGEDEVIRASFTLCADAFREATGVGVLEAVVALRIARPTEETWSSNRLVTCVVEFPEPSTEALAAIDVSNFRGYISSYLVPPGICGQLEDELPLPFLPSNCDEPHELEVIANTSLGLDVFDPDVVDSTADQICIREFAAYVGVPYADSELGMTIQRPTREVFFERQPTVQCLVEKNGLAGTVKDSFR